MPAPPARSSLFPAGALLPATFKTLLAQWFDYMLPLLGATGNAADARTALGAADDTAVVKLTGAQTVAGVKTFSDKPIIPDATAAQNPVSKAQLDAESVARAAAISAAVAPATLAPTLMVSGGAVAATSGAEIDFTSIPAWAKRVVVTFAGVSTNGTSYPRIQIGDSGGLKTSGYLGAASTLSGSSSNTGSAMSAGFDFFDGGAAASIRHGRIELMLVDAATNTWVASGISSESNSARTMLLAGSVALSGALDRVRLTTVGGANTFDAGLVNVMYE